MKNLLSIVLGAAVLFLQAPAQAQERAYSHAYSQAELDGLLAPVALYPDPLLSQILMASTYPADVGEAAAWSRANAHLQGEEAVRAAQHEPWDPSVKSLLAFPDVLARMDESPQWTMDLGRAFLAQEPHVMDTIQGLRRRAQASGHLQSNEHYAVQQQGAVIAVVPVRPQVVYVPYYSPHVVYGPWWWPAHRPVAWRPWRPAPVAVSVNFFFGAVDWHHRHVRVVHRPAYVHAAHRHVAPGRWQHDHARVRNITTHAHPRVPEANRRPIVQSAPAPIVRSAPAPIVRVPESQRRPIVQSAPATARPAQHQNEATKRMPPASQVQTPRPRSEAKDHPRKEQRDAARHGERDKKHHPRQAHGRDRHG